MKGSPGASGASGSAGTRAPAFCHVCGAALGARFYRYQHGLTVCATCQATRPRCARCGVPVADGVVAQQSNQQAGARATSGTRGAPLCASCLRSAPRCACCGEPIAQTWYTFEELLPPAAVRRYCERCVREQPRCDICRAPVPRSATVLADGQYRCALCATAMVSDEAEVRTLYDEALRLAHRVVGVRPRVVPALMVVGRRQMGDVRRRFPHTEPEGTGSQHVLGFFVREGGATRIYVELGLPRPLLLGTLAHELAHAWQVEVAPGVTDPLLREGFAEWVAHHVLVAGGHRPIAVRAARRDDLYGRGLRHFLAIERASGQQVVMAVALGERTVTLPKT